MDKIIMKNMGFFGYHGVMSEEETLGQKFFIDVTLFLDTKDAGLSDSVNKTVSYAEAFQVVQEHAEVKRYKLLEALAEQVAKDLLQQYGSLFSVEVEVRKPEAPVPGMFDYMGVHITRSRDA